ncbi:MAG: FHA domain-containing protein [Bacteroidales bacterium]|nr:FHA domain-containing protein [Bacteroidales bacterium]
MTQQKLVKIACRSCGKTFTVKHPGREATLKYTCPGCGAMVPVRFKASPAPVAMGGLQIPRPKPAPAADKPIPGTIIAGSGGGAYSGTFVADDTTATCSPVLRVTLHRPWLPDTVKDFPIGCMGRWTIGRSDDDYPSDISIPGDSSISRQSAVIEAFPAHGGRGSAFVLKVVKSLNPIRVNDREITQGESLGLNFGDIIVMGRTPMQFLDASKH